MISFPALKITVDESTGECFSYGGLLQKLPPEEHEHVLFGRLFAGLDKPLHRPVIFGPFLEPQSFIPEPVERVICNLEAFRNFPFHLWRDWYYINFRIPTHAEIYRTFS